MTARDVKRDIDETRRLGYMVLVYQEADGSHELVASLVNAIVHHQQRCASEQAIPMVLGALKGDEEQRIALAGMLDL